MEDVKKPHPVVTFLFAAFLFAFFGGGLLLFINLFIPFLPEAAFAIIALSVGAMMLVLLIVGKCIQVITTLRSATGTCSSIDAKFSDAQPQNDDS